MAKPGRAGYGRCWWFIRRKPQALESARRTNGELLRNAGLEPIVAAALATKVNQMIGSCSTYAPITSRKSTLMKSESNVAIFVMPLSLHVASITASAGNNL